MYHQVDKGYINWFKKEFRYYETSFASCMGSVIEYRELTEKL